MSTEDVAHVRDDENESTEEVTKVKRLPRSAKKRLRYERLRQQQKQAPKKKKKSRPSFNLPSSDATESNVPSSTNSLMLMKLSLSAVSMTGKLFKRTVNERLAEINRETTTPVICIDCAYNESMSGKVSQYHCREMPFEN